MALFLSLVFLPAPATIGVIALFALLFREPVEAGIIAVSIGAIFGIHFVPITAVWAVCALLGPHLRMSLKLPGIEA